MPLSEHEQRILADIEARLRADDPRFANTVGTSTVSRHLRNRMKLDVVAFVLGFALLFAGIQFQLFWGLLGFGLMLGAAYHGLTLAKRLASTKAPAPGEDARTPLQRYLGGGAERRSDDDS
jgi:hypothetical protein